MAKWNPLALKILMWLVGVLTVVASAANFVGVTLFPFDSAAGVSAPVAGVAFGAGLMIAGFDPVRNVSWVRAIIVYAILEVVYQILTALTIGSFNFVAVVLAILVAAVIVAIYPNRPALWMQKGATAAGARA